MEKEMKLNEQEMNELNLLNEFNVEELEKRYEMDGWFGGTGDSPGSGSNPGVHVGVSIGLG